MTEEIIKKITDAEALATEMKANAEAQADKILSGVEKKISIEEKEKEEAFRAYREASLKTAKEQAQQNFEQATEQAKREAKAYCADVLKNAELEINAIVGRMISGDS
jgi:vacuolar-type H+-ATPase subunit H